MDPRFALAYNGRAWIFFFKMGKPAMGLPDIVRALELDPKLSHSDDTRAHIYEALGRKEEALADFRKALALKPTIQTSQEGLTHLGATPRCACNAIWCLRGGSWPSKSAVANWAIIALLIETANLNGTVAALWRDDAKHAPSETISGFRDFEAARRRHR